MALKNKQKVQESSKGEVELWRKPLQVPARANAMRSFYQGAEDETLQAARQEDAAAEVSEKTVNSKVEESGISGSLLEKQSGEALKKTKADTADESTEPRNDDTAESNGEQSDKLTEDDLSRQLGFKIEDLFDIHELLRGKSFDIYRALIQSGDGEGRCKITQPELMRRTGIKNRRTFYKHEERLINLKLLEKRHLPGDHKGVVYRVFEMSDVLPVSPAMLEQFALRLNAPE